MINNSTSSFNLPQAIENYIDIRDEIWMNVANSAFPTAHDVGRLRTVNDALRQMLGLKPGPTTPVLNPLRAELEQLRCNVCAVFTERCQIEIEGYNRPGIPAPVLVQVAVAANGRSL